MFDGGLQAVTKYDDHRDLKTHRGEPLFGRRQNDASRVMITDSSSLSDIIGPWVGSDWDSSLIERCKNAWTKPLGDLSRQELATLLRQRIAVEHLLPIARKRLEDGIDDDTEVYDGELQAAIEYVTSAA